MARSRSAATKDGWVSGPEVAEHTRALAVRGIRIGTASWTDQSLLKSGRFYPADVKKPEERLRFYASVFPFVEIDSTYYTLDFAEQAELWAQRTPDDFLFDVKAFRLFTMHQTPHKMLPSFAREEIGEPPAGKRNWYYDDVPESLRDDLWDAFRRSLEPLKSSGRLGAVIFQLPPWVMPNDQSKGHLLECAGRMEGHKIAVEFRNQYWLGDRGRRRTLAFLRESGLAYVIVDEPQGFRSSVPPLWEVTDPDLAVVRLHGRNAETWEKKGLKSAAERFNYLYDDRELEEFADPVREVKQRAKDVHVTFNNNYEDYPQRNAAQFAQKLAQYAGGRR